MGVTSGMAVSTHLFTICADKNHQSSQSIIFVSLHVEQMRMPQTGPRAALRGRRAPAPLAGHAGVRQ